MNIRIYAVLFIYLVTATCPASAGFVDDWMAQKTVAGPQTLHTQKRGYYSSGSFSARWPTGNDFLVNVSPPKVSVGCGGIDAFAGSIDFIDFDYLVSKFETIIGNGSAAFAYMIAMSVLSEKIGSKMGELMGIIDRLNQLQLDDCKAGQAVAAFMMDASNPDVEGKMKTQALMRYAQESGAQDLYDYTKNLISGQNTTQARSTLSISADSMYSSCPQEVRDAFFTQGFVLDHLAGMRGYPLSYTELVRGMIGDVVIDANGENPTLIDKCPANSLENMLGALIYGDVQVRPTDPNGNVPDCQPMGEIEIDGTRYDNYREWVHQTLASIGARAINKQALLSSEEAFLDTIPFPIYKAIIVEIGMDGRSTAPAFIATKYTDFIAIMYAYNMVMDFYNIVHTVISTSEVIKASAAGASGDQLNCNIELADPVIEDLKKLRERMVPLSEAIYREYQLRENELNTNLQFAKALEEKGRIFNSKIVYQLERQVGL